MGTEHHCNDLKDLLKNKKVYLEKDTLGLIKIHTFGDSCKFSITSMFSVFSILGSL